MAESAAMVAAGWGAAEKEVAAKVVEVMAVAEEVGVLEQEAEDSAAAGSAAVVVEEAED